MNTDFSKARAEFPGWEPEACAFIPDGFIDASWHNDVAPSIASENGRVRVFLDFADEEKRECGGLRYSVSAYDDGGHYEDCVADTDSWEQALAAALRVQQEQQGRAFPRTVFGLEFDEWDTGGGCKALGHQFPDGSHILVTGLGGDELPTAREWLMGFYDKDMQETRWASSRGENVTEQDAVSSAQVVAPARDFQVEALRLADKLALAQEALEAAEPALAEGDQNCGSGGDNVFAEPLAKARGALHILRKP